MKNYIIYNDDPAAYIDDNKQLIIESLKDNELLINDNNILNEAINILSDEYFVFCDCLKEYDNKNKYDYILCFASLGLGYGKRQGKKTFADLKSAIFYCFEDYNKVYFDKSNTTIKAAAIHHDGVNNFTFYKVVNGKKYAIKLNDILSCF